MIDKLEIIANTLNEEGYTFEEGALRSIITELRPLLNDTDPLNRLLALVRTEYMRATAKHGPFPTCHHGHSVILEELEELWDEIKADAGNLGPAKREAIQIAVVAIRYAHDLCP